MKSLIISIALVLSAGSAMAQGTFTSAINDDMQIDFLSWCDGNNVVAQNEQGKPYVRANCEDQGQVCKVYDAYRMNRVIYSAACESKK